MDWLDVLLALSLAALVVDGVTSCDECFGWRWRHRAGCWFTRRGVGR